MQDITDLSFDQLRRLLEGWGEEGFRARQIFSWIYKKGVIDFTEMSDLSADLRKRLKENLSLCDLKLEEVLTSTDGTRKLLFRLPDGNFIEAVAITAQRRLTGCISTQAGCKFACCFCASGLSGFKRSLTSAEMLNEVLYLKNNSPEQKLSHIVFMGTGEPLDNYDHLLKAIRMINFASGLNIGARRITISTCGIIPGILKLATEGLQVELSVSLHSADDKIRSQIMPVNKIYPLKDLIAGCREYIEKTNRQVTFEYVLAKGVNSGLQDAVKLCKILNGLNCKVNLILINSLKGGKFFPPDKQEIRLFKERLLDSGINATLRKPCGQDIEAACGQLRLRYEKR